MKYALMLSATLSCFALPRFLAAQAPQMKSVEPTTGKIGDVLRVHGAFLGKTKVDELYLSDKTFDMKLKVLDQKDDTIEFRIPPFAKPGRLQLVMKTAGKQPLILEQPLYITVQEPTEQDRAVNTPSQSDTSFKQTSLSLLPANYSLSADEVAKSITSEGPLQTNTGRLIWTGALRKNALLSFSPDGASSGVLNGRLPGDPVKIIIHPAELLEGGIAVYSQNRLRSGTNEPPSAWNGWRVLVRDWDPSRITEVSIVEAPGPANDWKRLVLRNGSRNVSLVVVEWQQEPGSIGPLHLQ